MKTTYVLVADSSQARIFVDDMHMQALTELRTFQHPEGRLRDQELDSDRSGRQSATTTAGYHGYGGDKSSHRHEAEGFAADIARYLEQERISGNCEQLVLVAPPQLLGDLRKQLSADCDRLVTMEINKNLVNERPEHILGRLQQQRLSTQDQ